MGDRDIILSHLLSERLCWNRLGAWHPQKLLPESLILLCKLLKFLWFTAPRFILFCPLFKQQRPIILPGSPGLIQGTMDESKLMVKSVKLRGKLLNLSSFRIPPSVCHGLIEIIIGLLNDCETHCYRTSNKHRWQVSLKLHNNRVSRGQLLTVPCQLTLQCGWIAKISILNISPIHLAKLQ